MKHKCLWDAESQVGRGNEHACSPRNSPLQFSKALPGHDATGPSLPGLSQQHLQNPASSHSTEGKILT